MKKIRMQYLIILLLIQNIIVIMNITYSYELNLYVSTFLEFFIWI